MTEDGAVLMRAQECNTGRGANEESPQRRKMAGCGLVEPIECDCVDQAASFCGSCVGAAGAAATTWRVLKTAVPQSVSCSAWRCARKVNNALMPKAMAAKWPK